MKTTYILKLNNKKYLNRLLSYKVHFKKIKYQGDICFLYVNYDDYKTLIKYKDIYGIALYKIVGLTNYINTIKNNIVFIISTIFGILLLFILSNVIFDIKIMSNNNELIEIIKRELDEAEFKKYRFIKSFREKEQLRNKILNEYKDKIEWLEIDRVGTKYYVRVLERIIHKEDNINYQSIVARKNAIIKEIKASSGEIVKKINDYVNRGDEIISGKIMKKDEVKSMVEAKGSVYGETWYNVKVILPRTYNTIKYTGNSYNTLSIKVLGKRFLLFSKNKYQQEDYQDSELINDKLLPFSINKTKVLEKNNENFFYTYQEAWEKGLSLAREKLLNDLNGDSKILLQKKLKLYEENSTIIVEVFFKVYEDITDYKKIDVKEGE